MNRKQIRNELLRNMDKIIDMIKYEKRIKEEIWINKIRVDIENDLVYFQYEGATRIGFLIYCMNNNNQAETEINLIKNHRNKDIFEFRFKKEEGK